MTIWSMVLQVLPKDFFSLSSVAHHTPLPVHSMDFYTKLMFHEHVRRITHHATCATQGLIILSNSLQGASPTHCRLQYTQFILPIEDYPSLRSSPGSTPMC